MQSYLWHDNKTGKTIRVERPMNDNKVPPTTEELLTNNNFMTLNEIKNADWERVIEGGSFTLHWNNKGKHGRV